MDPQRFVSPRFGRVVRTPGPHGFHTFVPEPIPRSLLLDDAHIRREAVASSRIEGTQATIAEVFDGHLRAAAGRRDGRRPLRLGAVRP